jgi:hypothetical protein
MRALPESHRAEPVDYDISGRKTGVWDTTVSYASILFRESSEPC